MVPILLLIFVELWFLFMLWWWIDWFVGDVADVNMRVVLGELVARANELLVANLKLLLNDLVWW